MIVFPLKSINFIIRNNKLFIYFAKVQILFFEYSVINEILKLIILKRLHGILIAKDNPSGIVIPPHGVFVIGMVLAPFICFC